MKTETPRFEGEGLENFGGDQVPLDSTVDRLLAGEIAPHELEWNLWLVWSDGFAAGRNRMQARLDQVNAEADRLYFELHNPEAVRAERDRMLKHFDVVQSRRARAEGVSA